ncbi:MAG TPA: serine hydrolase domain-containing protein [Baekduia sp.]|uniref:serine hydrolase domain-containing protein n=1 Tax=Baekduia sp. TaxID=2600305 RepID=UPI002D767136|nr:serine hydrolase domain-containing protein [Baekduia sp.]HET6505324.1 serine hydrolase domain-containing protein [Baekduia sp.]
MSARGERIDDELREVIETALRETGTPGCAVGLAVGDRPQVEGFGLANAETGLRFTPATRIPVASMTKPYTATAILALAEAGRLGLDDPVRAHLPGFRVADAAAGDTVTIRHLLTHTAGWAGDRAGMKDPDADRGDEALARAVAGFDRAEQVSPPGLWWSYSNSAYMVAGRVIEAVCGLPYERAVADLVLEPLGLSESSFFVERVVAHPLAVGHVHDAAAGTFAVVRWPWACDRATNPSGGLISTVVDQLAWARWWAGTAPGPLSADARARALEIAVPAGGMAEAMALGWMVDRRGDAHVAHHGGSLWGIQTQSLFVPDRGTALVILTNALGGLAVQRRVREHVLARYAGLAAPSAAPGAATATAVPAGTFRLPAIGGERRLTVRAGDDGPVVHVPGEEPGDAGQEVRMRLVSADAMEAVDEPLTGLRAELLRDDAGRVAALRYGGRVAPRVA